MSVCVPCVCSAFVGQKRALALLELELQMIGSCHVGDRN